MSEPEDEWKARLRESLKETVVWDKQLTKSRRGRSKSQAKKESSNKSPLSERSNNVRADDVTQKIEFDTSSMSTSVSSAQAQQKQQSSVTRHANNKKPTAVCHQDSSSSTSSSSASSSSTTSSLVSSSSTSSTSLRAKDKIKDKVKPPHTSASTSATSSSSSTSTTTRQTKQQPASTKRVFGRRLGGRAVRLGGKAFGGGFGHLDVIEEEENENTATVFFPSNGAAAMARSKKNSPASSVASDLSSDRDSPPPSIESDGPSHSTKNDTIVFNTDDCKTTKSNDDIEQRHASVDGVDNDHEEITVALLQPATEDQHGERADHEMNSASGVSTRSTPQNLRQKNTRSSSAGSSAGSSVGSSAGKTRDTSSSGSNHSGKSETPVHHHRSQQHNTPHSSCSKSSKGGHTPRDASSTRSKHQIHVNGYSYSKLSLLGRGGSCKVFKVLAPDQQRVLALKRIKLTRTDRKTIAMFENEIELMQRLRGRKNIIQLVDYEINISKKIIYMIMEAGDLDLAHTLEAKKKDGAHLDADFLRVTWRQMLEAVNTIHEERIVHTDLKPANFLFVKGVLKLIDFGIAKAISDNTTNIHRENQVGTLNYISPEALIDTSNHRGTTPFGKKNMDMKMGRSSDIWSMGCILYQMIYGRTPFADLSLVHKLQAIVSDEFQISFPSVPATYQPALDVVKLCLQRDPKLRPGIIGEGGLLEHRFLHPEQASTTSTNDSLSPSSNEQRMANATLVESMRYCLTSENSRSEKNVEQFHKLISAVLFTGQQMERQQMEGHGFRASVADSIVEQLQKCLQKTENDNGSVGFDANCAVQHAKNVQGRAALLLSKKTSRRPIRNNDFAGQLKKKKSVLNKAPLQEKKTVAPESNSLQAALQQGFASRFAAAGLQDDLTLQENWTLSDEY